MVQSSTILIVDDQQIGRETLADLLQAPEHSLLQASDGLEALRLAVERTPDLVLLDVMMPGINGFEVCHRLRSNPHTAEIPIIMLTALDDHASRLRGIEAGADDFISKPFERIELRARVKTILRLNRYRSLLEERSASMQSALGSLVEQNLYKKVEEDYTELQRVQERLVSAYDAMIESWVYSLDLRNRETQGHTRRVTIVSVELARSLGLEGDALTQIRRGALLHDIGKLGIPESILLKPGVFSPEEWRLVREHPQYAQDILSPMELLGPALEIPVFHHERWDGSGYPRGLRDEQIPLSARIFSVVEVWDAMQSERPYRPAHSDAEARAYLEAQAGQKFDPAVIEAFLKLVEPESRGGGPRP